ncbi:MAG: MATE family efflux transporter [Lachnospiraceae bacterium]|nr:MATE family efflux transporter [Lachnospiraceae bacterium]
MKSTKQQTMNKKNELNIDWKLFYRNVFALVFPMALQNLINVGVTATDVIMLGKVGEKVLSGASLAGQVQFIMTLIFYGTTSGAMVLTAQYWGKKDTRTIEKVLGIGLRTGMTAAVLFAIAALSIPEYLMRIYTSDPIVISEGVKYLRIVAFSYVCMAVTQVYLNIMQSIERVIIATVIYASSLGVNIVINGVLIFGLFGAPKLGIVGAAIGTLCARTIETILVLLYAFLRNKVVRIHLKDILHIDKLLWKDFLAYAMPVMINEMMWGLGSSANTAVIGHLGSAAVAANSVAQVARQLATVVAFGISQATAIYLGKTIGEKKMEEAKAYASRFVKLSILLGCAGGILILVAAPIAKANLALTAAAGNYLAFMFFVMSYFTVAQAINTTMVIGVFRSGGDTKIGLIIDVSTMWGCSILLGAIAAFVFHASVPVVYVLLMSDELIKVPITFKRYRSYKWLKDVTRDQEELEGECV